MFHQLDESFPVERKGFPYPRCSMYGIFTYIWVIFRANVGKYSIHGASGICFQPFSNLDLRHFQTFKPSSSWLISVQKPDILV